MSNNNNGGIQFTPFNTRQLPANPAFTNLTYSNQNIQEFIQQLSEKDRQVMEEISKMETELTNMDGLNQEFTKGLSSELQKYTSIIGAITQNVLGLFTLIQGLHTQVSTTSGNNELINSLVSTLNSYFNKFHLLQNQIGSVSNNNKAMKTELDTRSKELFDAIDGLNGMFIEGFKQNGIFNIGGKLVTYAEIQNELRKYPNANQEITNLFSGAYNVGKYVDIEKIIGQLETLMNIQVGQQMPNQPQIVQPPQQPFVQQQQQPFVQQQQPSIGNDNLLIDGYPKEDIINKLNKVTNSNISGFNYYKLMDLKDKLLKNENITPSEKGYLLQFVSNFTGGKHLKKHKKTKVKRQSKRKRRFSKRRKSKAFRSKKA